MVTTNSANFSERVLSDAAESPVRMLVALALVIVLAMTAAWQLTDGFRAFTTEGARRLGIAEQPAAVPDAKIEFEDGRTASFPASLRNDARATIVVFFYVRCNAVCSILGSELQQLQDIIRTRGLSSRVRLLGISFDSRDDRTALREYAERMHADGAVWRMARIADEAERKRLLDVFGITVIPAPLGEFQHNAAFHVVSPDGRLTRIVDYDQPEEALAHALALQRMDAQDNGERL